MSIEEFRGMSDADAERCIGKTITFTSPDGIQQTGKITNVLESDEQEFKRLHLDKATKYLGFRVDKCGRLYFNAPLKSVTIE